MRVLLVSRPASRITDSSRRTEGSPSTKAGHSVLPLLISIQARRRIPGIRQATAPGAAAIGLLALTEVREGERLMAYQFVTSCANCGKQFGVLWVMDSNRSGPKNVARITCPLCRRRFDQDAKDLLPFESQTQNLVFGRPVWSVEIEYDCPCCGKPRILVSLLHTELSWDELSRENVQTAACDNGLCPQRGLVQKLKPTRVVMGALNPA
jgi:DNA-directed RNA polymerase subunit RPC12/RpoP